MTTEAPVPVPALNNAAPFVLFRNQRDGVSERAGVSLGLKTAVKAELSAQVRRVQKCLVDGSWQPVLNDKARHLPNYTTIDGIHDDGYRRCRQLPPTRLLEWQGRAGHCDRLLGDPHVADFGGAFEDTRRPVVFHVLGDSVANQLRKALTAAQATNPHLTQLRVVPTTEQQVKRLCLIPSDSDGVASLLADRNLPAHLMGSDPLMETLLDPTMRSSRHVLVLLTGAWYNLISRCSSNCSVFRSGSTGPCKAGDQWPRARHESPNSMPRLRNLSGWMSQMDPRRHPAHGYANYDLARIFGEGSNHPAAWQADVASFMNGLHTFNRARRRLGQPQLLPLWMETLPQHFLPRHDIAKYVPWSLQSESRFYRNATSGKLSNGCSVAALPLMACDKGNHDMAAALAHNVARFCTLGQAPGSPDTAVPEAAMRPKLDYTPRLSDACVEQLPDWRNVLLRPLLAAHGVPRVPVAAALSSRGDLHPGRSHVANAMPDCTHICEPSEASHHLARAVLSVAAAVLPTEL
jgi:hypothetical protein